MDNKDATIIKILIMAPIKNASWKPVRSVSTGTLNWKAPVDVTPSTLAAEWLTVLSNIVSKITTPITSPRYLAVFKRLETDPIIPGGLWLITSLLFAGENIPSDSDLIRSAIKTNTIPNFPIVGSKTVKTISAIARHIAPIVDGNLESYTVRYPSRERSNKYN